MSKISTCKQCTHHKFDPAKGIICGITSEKPKFENTCPSFEQNPDASIPEIPPLKPNDKRTRFAITLVLIVGLMDAFFIFTNGLQLNLLNAAENGDFISTEQAELNEMRLTANYLLYLIAFIISGITFILWFRRAYYNLGLKTKSLNFGDGWAAGAWFVPFVNLGRPLVMMREMYSECKNILTNTDKHLTQPLNPKLLILWWVMWLISGVLGRISQGLTESAVTVREFINITIFDMAMAGFGILLALVTVRVIKNYHEAEKLLAEVDKETRKNRQVIPGSQTLP